MKITVRPEETPEAAVTRTIKEEFDKSASATIVEWQSQGVESEDGMVFDDVLLEAVGIPEEYGIPEDATR